ncbi:Putative ribonuclease H protein At1g65750, partial [Linum grandiflorum]
LAWDLGFRNVQSQLDSATALSANTGTNLSDIHHRSCINEARGLISQDWSIRIIHTFREGNRAAYLLANHDHSHSFDFHPISTLPRKVQDCIHTNSVEIYLPHQIPLIN